MSEINHDQDPTKAAIAERVTEQLDWLNKAAEIAGGPVGEVFPYATEPRRDAPEPDWDNEQISGIREIAHRFGYGAEQDTPSGLQGGVRLLEGGLAWKIAAEDSALEQEPEVSTVVFSGLQERVVNDDERKFIESNFEVTLPEGATEYDLAHFFAQQKASRLADKPVVLPFGYAVQKGNPTLQEATGQLAHIGETDLGQDIYLVKVEQGSDRENRPDTTALMGFLSDVLDGQGRQDEPVAVITSNAYASRQPDAIRAGLGRGRQFGMAMYGRATLAAVKGKGTEMQADTPLNQLPGELRVMHEKLQLLAKEVA